MESFIVFDEKFWLAFSFILLILVLFKPLKKALFEFLDNRSNMILADLNDAARMKKEAEDLLKEAKSRLDNASIEAKRIIDHASEEAKDMLVTSKAKLEQIFENKFNSFKNHLKESENGEIQNILSNIIQLATSKLEKTLVEKLQDDKMSKDFVNKQIKNF